MNHWFDLVRRTITRFRDEAVALTRRWLRKPLPPQQSVSFAPPPPPPPPPPQEEKVQAPQPEAIPEPEPPPPSPEPTRATYSRRALNRYERARMKLDVFVEPKGPTPLKRERPKTAPKPREPAVEVDLKTDEPLIVDKIDGKDVAFKEAELRGEFNFRDTILDQLDRYWVYLARMKKHDRESYDLYTRLGAVILPPAKWLQHDGIILIDEKLPEELKELSPWWKKNCPSFGCVSYGLASRIERDELNARKPKSPKARIWIPKFMYFHKYRQPPSEIEHRTGGDIYALTVWWDRPQDKEHPRKWGIPQQYPIFVSDDGREVCALRTKHSWDEPVQNPTSRHWINGKRGHPKKDVRRYISHHGWDLQEELKQWGKENNTDPSILISNTFIDVANAYEFAHYSVVQVEVRKDDMVALFGVDPRRTSYFFQDRDVTLNKVGGRQRVFHIVKPHQRMTAKGMVTVPMHFRGVKEFTWAGYQVMITVPGRDHLLYADYDVGSSDSEYMKRGESVLDMKQLGDWLHDMKEQGWPHLASNMPRPEFSPYDPEETEEFLRAQRAPD